MVPAVDVKNVQIGLLGYGSLQILEDQGLAGSPATADYHVDWYSTGLKSNQMFEDPLHFISHDRLVGDMAVVEPKSFTLAGTLLRYCFRVLR